MKWLDNWFFNKFKQAWDADAHIFGENVHTSANMSRGIATKAVAENDSIDDERAISFRIIPAAGGRVVETRWYDRKKDRSNSSLYIIPSGEDIGPHLEKIISMETLKQ